MERTRAGDLLREVVSADFRHAPAAFEALTGALWQERELLEQLLFALTSQRLVLESANLRWLVQSSEQIDGLVTVLREHEVVRAIVTEGLVVDLGLSAPASLDGLVERAPEPYPAILTELRDALRELAYEVDLTIARNDELLLSLVRPRAAGRSPRNTQ